MPRRSSTRRVAPLTLGYIEGCTQPASAIICRAWLRCGAGPADDSGGTLARSTPGSSMRTDCPSFIAAPNTVDRGSRFFSVPRRKASLPLRGTFRSTTSRPMSSRRV